MKAIFKKLLEKLYYKAYKDISDMPMYNWLKCQEGDYRYIFHTPVHSQRGEGLYNKLYDQFLERFGMPVELRDYLSRMQAVTEANWAWVTKPTDPLANTNLMAAKLDFEALFENGSSEGGSKLVFVAAVEKYFGVSIDTRTTTVEQFYSRVELMKQQLTEKDG